ncbi:hypothetical protein FISHEDRAFT_76597 [Fistulina hepatica ATCC 64428]|uniref:Uncharacterized protein n=1 Tax=Fistulina hepatica ATCC 64428 TaxID=1128425 RepID=A0A0D7A681_9AGAR|nr:hypothetical protein FISHEDRAFT_76597 [Fistulina hepatica ATCC 64428]
MALDAPDPVFTPRKEFIRDKSSPPNVFSLLALASSNAIRLYSFSPTLIVSMRRLLEEWEHVLTFRTSEDGTMVEFILEGKPWSSPKSISSERLLLAILTTIYQYGYSFLSTIDYGREPDDRLVMAFSRPQPDVRDSVGHTRGPSLDVRRPASDVRGPSFDKRGPSPETLGPADLSPSPFLDAASSLSDFRPSRMPFALSFPSTTVLRVIAPPLNFTPAVLAAVRGSWPRGIDSEKKIGENCFEFKLKGYKWFQQDNFAVDSLKHILGLLTSLDAHSFTLLTSLTLANSRSRVKDLWIFTSPVDLPESLAPSVLNPSPDLRMRTTLELYRNQTPEPLKYTPIFPQTTRKLQNDNQVRVATEGLPHAGLTNEHASTASPPQPAPLSPVPRVLRKPAPRAQVPVSIISTDLVAGPRPSGEAPSDVINMTGVGAGKQAVVVPPVAVINDSGQSPIEDMSLHPPTVIYSTSPSGPVTAQPTATSAIEKLESSLPSTRFSPPPNERPSSRGSCGDGFFTRHAIAPSRVDDAEQVRQMQCPGQSPEEQDRRVLSDSDGNPDRYRQEATQEIIASQNKALTPAETPDASGSEIVALPPGPSPPLLHSNVFRDSGCDATPFHEFEGSPLREVDTFFGVRDTVLSTGTESTRIIPIQWTGPNPEQMPPTPLREIADERPSPSIPGAWASTPSERKGPLAQVPIDVHEDSPINRPAPVDISGAGFRRSPSQCGPDLNVQEVKGRVASPELRRPDVQRESEVGLIEAVATRPDKVPSGEVVNAGKTVEELTHTRIKAPKIDTSIGPESATPVSSSTRGWVLVNVEGQPNPVDAESTTAATRLSPPAGVPAVTGSDASKITSDTSESHTTDASQSPTATDSEKSKPRRWLSRRGSKKSKSKPAAKETKAPVRQDSLRKPKTSLRERLRLLGTPEASRNEDKRRSLD